MEGNIILDIKIAIFISRIFKLQNVRSEFVTIIILADFVVNVADVILPVFLDFPEVDSESQSVLVTAMILL